MVTEGSKGAWRRAWLPLVGACLRGGLQREILVLGKLQHPNLVRLMGYCAEVEEMLLVYEFVPRGSLDYHLWPGPAASQCPPSPSFQCSLRSCTLFACQKDCRGGLLPAALGCQGPLPWSRRGVWPREGHYSGACGGWQVSCRPGCC